MSTHLQFQVLHQCYSFSSSDLSSIFCLKRLEWDSNPRTCYSLPVFKTGPFNHLGTQPKVHFLNRLSLKAPYLTLNALSACRYGSYHQLLKYTPSCVLSEFFRPPYQSDPYSSGMTETGLIILPQPQRKGFCY